MILRRVIDHFRKQEWTAIFLDFLIVVIGVFVGIEVQDWNSARLARARAETYSERLTNDLRYEAWGYEYLIAYYKEVRENAERAIAAMTEGPALSDEQFVISAYRASQYLSFGARRSTYDELVATGDIGLIADRKLRETALTFYNDPTIGETTEDAKNSEFRRLFRRRASARAQHALLRDCGDLILKPGDFAHIVGTINYPCTLDLPTEEIAAAAAAFRTDADFLEALQLRFADTETAITNLEANNPALLANLRAIAKEDVP